jgi:hypothetical protein
MCTSDDNNFFYGRINNSPAKKEKKFDIYSMPFLMDMILLYGNVENTELCD